MTITKKNRKDDELRPSYRFDYAKAKPNRFASTGETLAVVLDPDVAHVFRNAESVNAVLRALLATMPAHRPKAQPPRAPVSNNQKMRSAVIVSDSEVMNGTPCFHGTRVPFRNLIEYLQGGDSIDEFLRQFPTVSREAAIQALEEAKESLLAGIA